MPTVQCGLWAALQIFQFIGEWMRWRFVPSPSASHQIKMPWAKRFLHALQLLIRKVWRGSEIWQSLWSCDCSFQRGLEHWMPWESCKPCCAFWGPLPDPWWCSRRWEDVSKAGRPQCNGFIAKITSNWHWTSGLKTVHEHGSCRGYKNTWSFFLGWRRRMPVFEKALPSWEKEPPQWGSGRDLWYVN